MCIITLDSSMLNLLKLLFPSNSEKFVLDVYRVAYQAITVRPIVIL